MIHWRRRFRLSRSSFEHQTQKHLKLYREPTWPTYNTASNTSNPFLIQLACL